MFYILYAEQEPVYIRSNIMLHIALSPRSHHILGCRTHQGCIGDTASLLPVGSMLSQWYKVTRVR